MFKYHKTPGLTIRMSQVGPWGVNAYALVCSGTRKSVLIDPGAESETLTRLLEKSEPMAIILTHSHTDHVGSLTEMRRRLQVPLLAHPGTHANGMHLDAERWLGHGESISVGNQRIIVHHTPGHSTDQISLLVENQHDAVVGDTIFPGGPGKTWSAEEFQTTLETLRTIVLLWSDKTVCYPGHGPSFRLGDKRRYIEAFLQKDHGAFFGDATWDM